MAAVALPRSALLGSGGLAGSDLSLAQHETPSWDGKATPAMIDWLDLGINTCAILIGAFLGDAGRAETPLLARPIDTPVADCGQLPLAIAPSAR